MFLSLARLSLSHCNMYILSHWTDRRLTPSPQTASAMYVHRDRHLPSHHACVSCVTNATDCGGFHISSSSTIGTLRASSNHKKKHHYSKCSAPFDARTPPEPIMTLVHFLPSLFAPSCLAPGGNYSKRMKCFDL